MAGITNKLFKRIETTFLRIFFAHLVQTWKSFFKSIIPRESCVEGSVHILGLVRIQSVSGTVSRHVLDALNIVYFIILNYNYNYPVCVCVCVRVSVCVFELHISK